jgi:protein SCO1/2
MNTRRLAFVAAALSAALLGVATWSYLQGRPTRPPDINGYVLAQPRALPAVELVDEHAAPFRSADFAGHWSFLYFGYTYCPDVCPLTLVTLASVKTLLAAEQPPALVEYYLVSVDPRRDTPERLREYVAYFEPAFHGLTGATSALAVLTQATETLFDVPEGQDTDNYLVSHSSNIVLLDPRGHVRAVFTPPHDPAALAADFTKVAERYSAAH